MSLISPCFDVKSSIFSQFWPGAFCPKLLEKALDDTNRSKHTKCKEHHLIIVFIVVVLHENLIMFCATRLSDAKQKVSMI